MSYKKLLLCITRLRNEEKHIYDELKEIGFDVEISLDSASIPYIDEDDNKPDVAFVRSISQSNALSRAMYLDYAGIKVINSVKSIMTCTNKLSQALLFNREKIEQPDFKVAFNSEDVINAFSHFKKTFVIKPLSSSWGRGIVRIINEDCLEAWLAARDSVDLQEKHYPLLLQEYINKNNFDIRVFIIGKTPIVAFKRVSNKWKTNTHLGAEVVPIPICEKINDLSQRVIKVIGEGIYGLDLMYDFEKKLYLVCEINHNPEFANSSKIHKVNLPKLIALYLNNQVLTLEKGAVSYAKPVEQFI